MPPPTSQPRKPDLAAKSIERNQYIPSFIANKPFYVPDSASTDDYLEHQRLQSENTQKDSTWYDRGNKVRGPIATKFRKGACENCGSMTHKTKECLSRKRKHGARWTGKDIQADEVLENVDMGWDAKRDRWNGYDASQYESVVQEYNEMEVLKNEGQEGADGDRYEEETDMGRQQSTSTRQLRLREDTAKYLLNLDLDSAKYDPKTRSMLDPGANDDQAAALVAEEGFVRKGGDAAEFEKAQRYAWERQEAGDKLHLQANPTAGALALKKQVDTENERKEAQRKLLLDKYGSQDAVRSGPTRDKVTSSEHFVEYDESGDIKGRPKIKPKSQYAEDVYIQNHTSVWGSWWSNFQWGYACCHSLVKNSYCTGEAGKEAFENDRRRKAGIEEGDDEEQQDNNELVRAIEIPPVSSSAADDRQASATGEAADMARRKRTAAEMTDGITAKEMEEYRRKRSNAHDPMSKMLGKDVAV